jgi:hypothetical protein
MDIEDIMAEAHGNALTHGWLTKKPREVPEQVALIHSEATEILNEWRDGHLPQEFWYEHPGRTGHDRLTRTDAYELDEEPPKPVGIPSELADVVIRACQASAEWGIDLNRAIREKLAHNRTRPYMHGRVH